MDNAFRYSCDGDQKPETLVRPDSSLLIADEHRLAREIIFDILYKSNGSTPSLIGSKAYFPEGTISDEIVSLNASDNVCNAVVPGRQTLSGMIALSLRGREYYESKLLHRRQQAFIIAACNAPKNMQEKQPLHLNTLAKYKAVVESIGLEPIFQEHEEPRKNIFVDIFDYIDTCELVIADLTFERPNCYIEVGYALARAKPVLIFIENEYFEKAMENKLPFDISPVKMQNYQYDKLDDLERILRERIGKVRSR
ncbi:MAG: hypothetical protein IPG71_02140 [bacterium]|nr:hypothetical protein [bacterium]